MADELTHRLWRGRTPGGKTVVVLLSLVVVLTISVFADLALEDEQTSRTGTAKTTAGSISTDEDVGEATTTERPDSPIRVENVVDGDTINLDNGNRVRLVQIDAPEPISECYGRDATEVLRQLLPRGTQISLRRDRRLDDRDEYGRLLRYVFKGSLNVNLALVERGAASVYFFHGDRGSYAAKLLSATKRARAAGRGAWGACRAELNPRSSFQTFER